MPRHDKSHPNASKLWTEEEEAALTKLMEPKALSLANVANQMGRSLFAVRLKAEQLNLPMPGYWRGDRLPPVLQWANVRPVSAGLEAEILTAWQEQQQ